MNTKSLICFASKYGSTKEIAERIYSNLFAQGINLDLSDVEQVESIVPYQNIVLGVALYMGRWKREAKRFVKKYEKELSGKSLWIFCSGPTGKGNPSELLDDKVMADSMMNRLQKIGIKELKIFHGAIDLDKLNAFEKWIMKRVKAETGDFRDWDEINIWSEYLYEQFAGTSFKVTP